MAKGPSRRSEARRALEFVLPFEGKPEKELDLSAYAFDQNSELLTVSKVERGVASIELTDEQAAGARIVFGPTVGDRRIGQPSLEGLKRLRAYEPAFAFDPKVGRYEVLAAPDWLWRWWLWCSCRVQGQVVRPLTVEGITTDMPVCNARVHICEVDSWWWLITRIPDDVVIRIRDELLAAIQRPFPPLPDPGPEFKFDSAVIDPTPEKIARMNRGPGDTRLDKPMGTSGALGRFATQTAAMSEITLPTPLDPTTRSQLSSRSLQTVRNAIIANVDLIRPWICWWPWLWPYFYWCDEMAVVQTDSQGNFDTTIWYLCFDDTPDLYFWVEYCIGGVWTTVYDPGFWCGTYWDFACGTNVVLPVNDPRVPWCGGPPPLLGMQVAVLSIGHEKSLHQIQGQAAGTAEGLASDGRPFGASLEPTVWFSQDNLIAAGITHYRWSYRRLGSLGSWTVMDRQVIRHYAMIDGLGNLTFKPYLLGPDPAPAIAGFNLFKIQPTAPPPGSFGWTPQVDARENTASAFFLSHTLDGGDATTAAGQYELKLELFDGAGNLINWTDAGVVAKVPTVDAPFGVGSVPTTTPAPEHLILDGLGKTVAFRLVLHVDNNVCQAAIHPVSIAGSTMDPCGFIKYHAGSQVHVSFLARHPNDFATFTFVTDKGTTGDVLAATVSGSVTGPTINGFTRVAASEWAKDILVSDLLGGCDKAAFAETLHVYAMATDGWSILTYLDRDATPQAYALEPGP